MSGKLINTTANFLPIKDFYGKPVMFFDEHETLSRNILSSILKDSGSLRSYGERGVCLTLLKSMVTGISTQPTISTSLNKYGQSLLLFFAFIVVVI